MGYIGSVILLIAILVTRSIFMTFGETGVCIVPVSKMQSRYTPYTQTYEQRTWNIFRGTRYKTMTRRNYKIVYSNVWETVRTCCTGYREVSTVCVPYCEEGCVNGNCTAPNNCSCYDGYISSSNRAMNHVCEPFCKTCVNGICTAPDVCTCNEGYVQKDFNLTNESLCVPFCENCENGECVAPNECQCHSGFQRNENNSSCIKPCTRACKGHGVCIEDEKPCKCSYGWTGWDCDQPIVCILLMDRQDKNLEGLTIYSETNSTLMDARRYAPYCYQCNETVGSGNFCFAINSNNESSTVGCFVETESPCYMLYHSNTDAVSRMAGTFAAVTILIIVAATAAAYFVHRRYQRRKLNLTTEESMVYQASATNEPLLRKEENFSTLSLDDIEK